MDFNLLDKEWIPVLYRDGRWERVGIRTALQDAAGIRQIAASNPMDNVALLRLLLAVLQWCRPTPTEDELKLVRSAGRAGIPGDWLNERLGLTREPNTTFDLLGGQGGFYQDGGAGGNRVAVTNLLHDLPSGSNIAHFQHVRDHRAGMCLPCCALGLVRWPGVASAGTAGAGQSMTACLNGNTPAYSIPVGEDLLATLLLAWPDGPGVEGDEPIWHGASEQSPLGFLKGMTWGSRRILLAPPDTHGNRELSSGYCCYCGEPTDYLVKAILFRPGWQRPSKDPWSQDPHLLRITQKGARGTKEKKIVPSWPSPNDPLEDHASVWRSVFRGLLQRLAASQDGTRQFRTILLGISQALYKHVGEHTVAMPKLTPDVAQGLLAELEWLRQVTWVTIAARGGNWRDPPKGHCVVRAVCGPTAKGYAIRSGLCAFSIPVEHELERAFANLIGCLATADQAASDPIVRDWRDMACRILSRHVGRVVEAAKPASPLRRRETEQRVDIAVLEAVHHIDQKKGPTP